MGFLKHRFFQFFYKKKPKNIKSPNFGLLGFYKKKPSIQILDSQSQQKIVAFQSNWLCL